MIKAIIEFFLVFIIFILLYFVFSIRKNKKLTKNNTPIELYYLINVYGIDKKKINYKKFLWLCAIVNSFIISFIYTIVVYLIEGTLWQILVGFILLVLLIIISYGLIGRYYQRKGDK